MKPMVPTAGLTLVDFQRYGWTELDPHISERARRRDVVNTFLAGRSYWQLMTWLAAKLPTSRRFMTIGEALALAEFEYGRDPSDERKMVVVVARYFSAARWHWLEAA